MKIKLFFLVMIVLACNLPATAQYTINGDATQDNCNCYTLTQAINTQGGSVWNNNKIDLSQSFDFIFQVFLGCVDANGADGISFVLQPISTSVGSSGGGMGFQGISPSVGVTLDTYQNSNPDNDPFYDHIAIQLNGIINHSSPSTLTPLTPISATNNNVEDCQNHSLRIVWNAITKNLTVFFDGQQRVTTTYDFVNNVFGGNNLVYWGFTGATGGLNNLQKFCTSLTPSFYFPATQNRCVNEPITFLDSTISFTGLQKRYWNFGDGSPIDSVNINPVHTYTAPGIYNVTLKVIGLDGCEAVFPQLVYVGGKPVAGFTYTASCVLNNVQFTDTSRVSFGTINSWYWDLDNSGFTSTVQNPSTIYTTPGTKNIKFVVKTQEGCVSDTLFTPIAVNERAVVDFTFTDSVCFGTATSFTDLSTVGGSAGGVNYWQWTYSDSSFPATVQNPTHVFSTPGNHTVTLISSGSGSNNCAGSSITKTIFVTDKPIAALKNFVACERQSIQLQDSSYTSDGTAIGSCWWDLGNGQFSNQCNPRVTYTGAGPITIKHVVFNARGCKSDTLTITIDVADKPLVKFGFNAPICNDSSIRFTDSTTVVAGNTNQWNWIHNNSTFSQTQNPLGYFPFGNVQVGLSATSNLGCVSDTIYKTFKLIKNPVVDFNFNDTCKFDPVIFRANETTTNIGINDWQWQFGDGQTGAGTPVTNTYTANGQYTVTLIATSIEGCKDTATDIINIYGTDAYAGADVIAAPNQPIQLQATGGISYQWIPPNAGLSATNIPNPIAINTTDNYYVLKAFTPSGCASYDTIRIFIYKGPEVYFPTAFTPNGDGLNETIKPFLVGVVNFKYFAIYNRYGQKMFYTTNPNKGWDGTYRGQKQPMGTYVWVVEGNYYNSATNVPRVWKGTVMILN